MSRRYTEQEKADALAHLDANYGDVTLTSIQTDIPKRTLQEWKRERKLQALRNSSPAQLPRIKNNAQQQQAADDNAEEPLDYGEYTSIREQLMEHIHKLTAALADDPEFVNNRAVAITRLLDRVIKLEAYAHREVEQVIRIEYKYPDGSIHTMPSWSNPNYNADDPYTAPSATQPAEEPNVGPSPHSSFYHYNPPDGEYDD